MNNDALGLSNKRAIVVGAGSGIGRATARLLAGVGADVALVDISSEAAESVAEEARAEGVRAVAIAADVTERSEAERAVAEAVRFHRGLDVVVNIVGMAEWADLFEMDDATWDLDLARNLRHHVYVGTAAARQMVDQQLGGRIAMVASVTGLYGAPRHAAYGVAKSGVISLARTMAQEWGRFGIRVNAVAPDMIATPRVRSTLEGAGIDLVESARRESVLLERFGEPEEIAGALVFLVSDLASFITGQTIVVDGGVRAAFPHAPLTTAGSFRIERPEGN